MGRGVAPNHVEALKWFRKAAEQGVADAQNDLGACYAKGEVVSQDYEEAAKWFRKAAEQGHPRAQYSLGLVYARGLGVPQNYLSAYKWYSLAAAQRYKDSVAMLAEVKAFMSPEEITEGKRLVREFVPRRGLTGSSANGPVNKNTPNEDKPGPTSN
jgi:TPR repeat protein